MTERLLPHALHALLAAAILGLAAAVGFTPDVIAANG